MRYKGFFAMINLLSDNKLLNMHIACFLRSHISASIFFH